jgi:hypothetical protein
MEVIRNGQEINLKESVIGANDTYKRKCRMSYIS